MNAWRHDEAGGQADAPDRERTRGTVRVVRPHPGSPAPPASLRIRATRDAAREPHRPAPRASPVAARPLEENLKALGNTTGRADRSRLVRIELTPGVPTCTSMPPRSAR